MAQTEREQREAIVREHMASENRHDFDATIATFSHPRNELIALHHADDGVWVELDLLGTHLGPLAGFEPPGQTFRCRMAAFFEFDSRGEGIVCERVFFDSSTILRQLGLLSRHGRVRQASTASASMASR